MDLRKSLVGVATAAAVIAASLSAPALAQPAATYSVTSVQGDVLVLRGNQVFTLRAGDTLQAADQVFTRAQAATVIQQLGSCSLPLSGATTVTIPSASGAACNLTSSMIQSLSASTTMGGVTIGAVGVGAAAPVLGALALVGVGAAVSNNGSPASN